MEKAGINQKLQKVFIFILGVVATLAINKIWNKVLPEQPTVIKEITDSIKVVHEFKIPVADDSLSFFLEKKIKNLKLINDYEAEIDKRIKGIKSKDESTLIPNLINPDISREYSQNGYMYGNASPYFSIECPEINGTKYIDFKLSFLNKAILNKIAFLRLNIFKFDDINSKDAKMYIMNEFYDINMMEQNLVRIENTLSPGKYEFQIGFTLTSDLTNKYPTFYFKRCNLIKN